MSQIMNNGRVITFRSPISNRPLTSNNPSSSPNNSLLQNSHLNSNSSFTQSHSPQIDSPANQQQLKKQEGPQPASLSQFLKSSPLTAAQKNSLHNLAAFVQVISANQFEGMLRNQALQNNLQQNNYSSQFFNASNENPNFFNQEEITEIIALSGICPESFEEDFFNLLVSHVNSKGQNYLEEMDFEDFHASFKELFNALEIEEKPTILKTLQMLLNKMQHSQHTVSGEQKRQILDVLKEAEEKEVVKGIKFDYAEISEV